MKIKQALSAVTALCSIIITQAASAQRYEVIGLGAPSGQTLIQSNALALSNSLQIVGKLQTQGDSVRAFQFNGTVSIIDGGNYISSFASDVNNVGVVLGQGRIQDSPALYETFTWSNGVKNLVPGFPSGASSPEAINDSGAITGWYINQNRYRAIRVENGVMTNLGTLPGVTNGDSWGHDINASNIVVGYTSVPSGTAGMHHAFLHDGTSMQSLGVLPGKTNSKAWAINSRDQVVGESYDQMFPSDSVAFIYQNGVMRDLGSLPGSTSCYAKDINKYSQAIGTCHLPGPNPARAVLFSNGIAIDLNDLITANSGWVLRWAESINDHMEIVGRGDYQGQQRAFLLKFQCPKCPKSRL